MFFKKKEIKSYNQNDQTPVLKCSICTGEKVAGFINVKSGRFTEDMLINKESDLNKFKDQYHITGEIEKIY